MGENSSILRGKAWFPGTLLFDTGEKGALGYGDFPSKTAVIASRAVIAGEHASASK
jgi:hypothetical protein